MTKKKPGRPVTNSVRRAFYLPPDVDRIVEEVPKNSRSKLVAMLLRAWHKRNKT